MEDMVCSAIGAKDPATLAACGVFVGLAVSYLKSKAQPYALKLWSKIKSLWG